MRSERAVRSSVTMWTSSWFMIRFMRSLLVTVSKGAFTGAMLMARLFRGTELALAPPASAKSVSSTVMRSVGVKSKRRFWKASELRNVRAACGIRNASSGT